MNRDCILEMNAKQSVLTKQLWKNVLVATLHYSSSYFTNLPLPYLSYCYYEHQASSEKI